MHNVIIEFGTNPDSTKRLEAGVQTAVLDNVPEDTDVFRVLSRAPRVPQYVLTDVDVCRDTKSLTSSLGSPMLVPLEPAEHGVATDPSDRAASKASATSGTAESADARRRDNARARAQERWQRGLLPMMIGTVIVATLAFLALSLLDTWSVRSRISQAPVMDLSRDLASVNCRDMTITADERGLCLQWKVAVLLEQETINRRYHQANVALLVRVSVKYLGFLTGMLMSLVGAVFVLGRLTEAPAEFSAEGPFGKLTLATVSPGIILAALGTILMLTTVMVNPPTDVTDGNVYLRSGSVADTAAGRRQ